MCSYVHAYMYEHVVNMVVCVHMCACICMYVCVNMCVLMCACVSMHVYAQSSHSGYVNILQADSVFGGLHMGGRHYSFPWELL